MQRRIIIVMTNIILLEIQSSFQGMEQVVYPVLMQNDDSLVLLDCGYINSLVTLEEAVHKAGFALQGITHLLLTHHDHDHMGNAAEIKAKYPNVKIAASALEEPYISGKRKSLRLEQAERMQELLPPEQKSFGEAFCDVLRRVKPLNVDIIVNDGDHFAGCDVIATPGHTPGHISLYLPKQKTVITGDAMALEDGVPVIANLQFTLDMSTAKKSMDKLLSLDANTYICYHGGVYRKETRS